MNMPVEAILPDQPRLAGRRIVVTGAASGMGKAIAELFAAQGAKLTLLDVQAGPLAEVASRHGATGIVTDVASEESVAHAIAGAVAAMGGIDGVVNAAGILRTIMLEDTTPEIWREMQGVNLFGPYLLANAALPHLRAAGEATIVNIASMGGINPPPRMACYAASKAGLIALTKVQATEWGPNIRANAIAPGIIRTPMTDAVGVLPGSLSATDAPPTVALGRKGMPMEVAYLALFLSSRESAFVNGAVHEIHGGVGMPKEMRVGAFA
jgi:NAD(P)-dependent dehydrogenase (short-subunit alcohol dehydrogenase family)